MKEKKLVIASIIISIVLVDAEKKMVKMKLKHDYSNSETKRAALHMITNNESFSHVILWQLTEKTE